VTTAEKYLDTNRRSDPEVKHKLDVGDKQSQCLTKSDLKAQEEADIFLESRVSDRKHRQLISKKVIYTPDTGNKSRSLITAFRRLGKSTEKPLITKVKPQFHDNQELYVPTTEHTDNPKTLIKPQPLGILTPPGQRDQYKPLAHSYTPYTDTRYTTAHPIHPIFEKIRFDPKNPVQYSTERKFNIIPPITDITVRETFYDIDNKAIQLVDREDHPNIQPEPRQLHFANDQDDDLLYEGELDNLFWENLDINMAAQPPVDIAAIIRNLQGDNEENRQNAVVQLAEVVQRINPPAPASPAPQRLTLRQALEQGREGAADDLKVMDLLPDPWGNNKDGSPEAHCIRFENYAIMHNYDNDPTKIAWFQATLKGEALNWFTAEGNFATWEELKQAFIAEFENQPSRNVAIGNFRNLSWNGTERASSYLQRLKKAARIINANDDEVMIQFQIGLPKAVKLFFGATNPTNLREMTQTLQKYLELHGPVAINTNGASQALSSIAELLTGGTGNPFEQNPLYTRTMPTNEETAAALRFMARQNSALNSIAVSDIEKPLAHERHRSFERPEKRVTFRDRRTRSQSPNTPNRNQYRDRSSDNEGGATDDSEGEDNDQNRKSSQTRRRDQNGNPNHRRGGYNNVDHNKQYDVTDQLTKLMPMIEAMADIGRRGNTNGRGRYNNGYRGPDRRYQQQTNENGNYNWSGGSNKTRPDYRQGRGRGQTSTRGTCFYCGNYGHFQNECRIRQRDIGRPPNAPNINPNRNQNQQGLNPHNNLHF
jgi:hypothetical protein